MGKKRRLLDEYQFPGVRPRSAIRGMFGDPKARIIWLDRIEKKRHAVAVAPCIAAITTRQRAGYGTCHAGMFAFTCQWRFGEFRAGSAGK